MRRIVALVIVMLLFLDSQYSVDESRSVLCGHSNGGAFTYYPVFHSDLHENQPFHYYIIGSSGFICPFLRGCFVAVPLPVIFSNEH